MKRSWYIVQIHERIKMLRKQRGLSQDMLASMVGYHDRSSVAKVEAGKVDLSQSKIRAFANALGVTPAYLLGLEDAEANLQHAGLSWDTVAEEMGLPSWAIDQILQNTDHPEVADKVIRVANLLAADMGSEGSGITPREYKLVTLYRTASDKDRTVVDTVLGMEQEENEVR